ncbi:hypothetical protein G6F68_012186 [Rhizopus microsporus]|nr:hypothetical protein G6F68_012186 [Rhizopus microsporus]
MAPAIARLHHRGAGQGRETRQRRPAGPGPAQLRDLRSRCARLAGRRALPELDDADQPVLQHRQHHGDPRCRCRRAAVQHRAGLRHLVSPFAGHSRAVRPGHRQHAPGHEGRRGAATRPDGKGIAAAGCGDQADRRREHLLVADPHHAQHHRGRGQGAHQRRIQAHDRAAHHAGLPRPARLHRHRVPAGHACQQWPGRAARWPGLVRQPDRADHRQRPDRRAAACAGRTTRAGTAGPDRHGDEGCHAAWQPHQAAAQHAQRPPVPVRRCQRADQPLPPGAAAGQRTPAAGAGYVAEGTA